MASDRRWLNEDKDASAFVLWWVEPKGERGEYVDATLKIADCDRVATLDFDGYSEDSKEASVRKAKRLLSAVKAFAAALEAAVEESANVDG